MNNNSTPTDFPTLEEAAAEVELERSKSSEPTLPTPTTKPAPEASPETPPGSSRTEVDPEIPHGSTFQKDALRLLASGISLIPVKPDGSKSAAVPWKRYQSQRATAAQIAAWCRKGYGLAVVAGKVSGNLEILDFDDPAAFDNWTALVESLGGEELLKKLPIVMTPSGFHVYYRCEDVVEGNQKLAQRKGSGGRPEVLVETRGEGGYVLLPGSPPECHPSKQPYILVQGVLSQSPTISSSLLLD